MKKSTMAAVIGLTIGLGLACETKAASKVDDRTWPVAPVGVGLAAPIQVPWVDTDIHGFRFGFFFGLNNDMYGLDLGLAEMSAGKVRAAQIAGLTWTEGDICGCQLAGIANVGNSDFVGAQFSPVNVVWGDGVGAQFGLVNYTTDFKGAQFGGIINWNNLASYGIEFGLVNADQDEFKGWALGLINYADKTSGFSCGFLNAAYDVTGCQLGVFNACDRLHGVQIGAVNMICESKLPIMVVANAAF